MQKYHDEPKQYKGYLKSALASRRLCRFAPSLAQSLQKACHPRRLQMHPRIVAGGRFDGLGPTPSSCGNQTSRWLRSEHPAKECSCEIAGNEGHSYAHMRQTRDLELRQLKPSTSVADIFSMLKNRLRNMAWGGMAVGVLLMATGWLVSGTLLSAVGLIVLGLSPERSGQAQTCSSRSKPATPSRCVTCWPRVPTRTRVTRVAQASWRPPCDAEPYRLSTSCSRTAPIPTPQDRDKTRRSRSPRFGISDRAHRSWSTREPTPTPRTLDDSAEHHSHLLSMVATKDSAKLCSPVRLSTSVR